ncbi:MAG: hypothetical protein PVH04_00435, partial [Gammaproteobacteria bacterium]
LDPMNGNKIWFKCEVEAIPANDETFNLFANVLWSLPIPFTRYAAPLNYSAIVIDHRKITKLD